MSSIVFFPRASFLSGAARTFDLWGDLDMYNFGRSGDEADAMALYSDWRVVGEHLFESAATFDSNPEQLELFPRPSVKDQLERASSE